MDLDPNPVDEAFRAEVKSGLAAILPERPLPSVNTEEGFAAHREFERKLFDARLAVVSWPERYGGRDTPLSQWLVFEEEYYRAGGPVRVGQNGLFLLAPTLFAHGSTEQLDRILPPMATAEQVWAQAWSEPGAGSDLAAIRSTAGRTEGGWLLSGQKTWSSRAAFADRAFGLFRSDPEGRGAVWTDERSLRGGKTAPGRGQGRWAGPLPSGGSGGRPPGPIQHVIGA